MWEKPESELIICFHLSDQKTRAELLHFLNPQIVLEAELNIPDTLECEALGPQLPEEEFCELSETALSILAMEAYVTSIPKTNGMLFEFLSDQELLKTIKPRHLLCLLCASCRHPPQQRKW